MAEKDFVLGNGNVDSDLVLSVIKDCCVKGVKPITIDASKVLVTNPNQYKAMQAVAKGKVLLNVGGTMLTLVLGGEATTSLPKDVVNEFYSNLQDKVSKLPDAENAHSELEFIDLAIKQGEALRDKSNEGILHALKEKVLSTVSTSQAFAQDSSTAVGIELDPVLSAN